MVIIWIKEIANQIMQHNQHTELEYCLGETQRLKLMGNLTSTVSLSLIFQARPIPEISVDIKEQHKIHILQRQIGQPNVTLKVLRKDTGLI